MPIAANTVYVASYYAPNGGYAVDVNYFATAGYDNAPLHALEDGVSGGDGVYVYGSSGTFPTGSYQSDNYWVDVVLNTVTQAPATHFSVSAPTSATAGVPFNITVTALNASNSTATGYTGTVHFTSSDSQVAGLPANYTFTAADDGVHTFTGLTLKTAGSQTVTATDTVTSSITGSATVAVSPAAASTLVVTAPTSATAGVPISVTVTAKDPYGNTATGYLGTVHFTSSDSQTGVILPANYTFTAADAGVHTFTNGVTLETAGNQTVTATDTSTSSITGSATVTVASAAQVTHLNVSAPTSATAGTAVQRHRHGAERQQQHGHRLHRHGPLHQQRQSGGGIARQLHLHRRRQRGAHLHRPDPEDRRQPDGHRHRHGHLLDHRFGHRGGQPGGGQHPGGDRPGLGHYRHALQRHRHRQGPLRQHRYRLHWHGPLHQQRQQRGIAQPTTPSPPPTPGCTSSPA